MDLQLRPHQMKCVEELREGFRAGHRVQLLYAPTGFGKTEVAIYLMKAAAERVSRTAIIMDRIVLVDQTSDRLTKYAIPHGVLQASHWNYAPKRLIQVCSAQTLESRDEFPDFDLAIIDECHISRKSITEFIKAKPNMRVIGLTATPFTKGLGGIYENVVTGASTEFLVNKDWLAPLKVYIAKQIDMTGAKKVAGEWSQDVATERGMRLTGDIVAEWIKKTHEIFGGPKKTIVFCSGVAHGADLAQQFAKQGYNFVPISYKDNDEFKREAIADFSKPDTQIHGLIATDILTRGFDVPDVMIGVSARPFSKSLSSHIQQLGRVMRSHHSKEFGVWLCHSGNFMRFMDTWDDVYANGVRELSDDAEKPRREPTDNEKYKAKCPKCGLLWTKGALACAGCGFEKRAMRSSVESVAGALEELVRKQKADNQGQQRFYSELLWYAAQKHYNPNWAAHKYREKFGAWPRGLGTETVPPSAQTIGWIRSRMIAYAKSRRVA